MNQSHNMEYETLDVTHEEFRRGLPVGRYRVVINPALAQKYVQHRLWIKFLMLPVIGTGVVLGLYGYLWVGIPLMAIGILGPRLIRKKASELLLHLAMQDRDVYREAVENEILEVRGRR